MNSNDETPNPPPSDVAGALAWTTGRLRATSDTPRLDAELLLAHVLGWSRARMLAEGRAPLRAEQRATLEALLARRAALEPVAYLIGHKEFYGLDFVVDRRVLVPRPETELLIELALRLALGATADDRRPTTDTQQPPVANGRSSVVVADIGTGSGCIAIALAKHLLQARVIAVDLSADTLEVARLNAERHGVTDRVRLIQGDLLAPVEPPVDLLVSNPPYTILAEIDAGVRRHEPHRALDGGPDGLDLYRRLLAQAPAKLRPGGAALLEIGATQGSAVAELARTAFPEAQISVHKDLAGHDRVVVVDTDQTRRHGDKEN